VNSLRSLSTPSFNGSNISRKRNAKERETTSRNTPSNRKEERGTPQRVELLNEIETELKSTTLYTAIANEPQPIKKNEKQEIQEAVKRAAAWSKERKTRKSK